MAKKDINKFLKHYNEYSVSPSYYPESSKPKPEPDKSKSISELNRQELWDMLSRLRDETDVQRIIRELKRNSGEQDTYDKPFKIDTKTPINQLYHFGIKGQKWGVRKDNTDTIEFPKSEVLSLKKRLDSNLSIYTTRTSSELGKYAKDEIYKNPILGDLKVVNIIQIDDISKHPFINELNKTQINVLARYGKMELIELKKDDTLHHHGIKGQKWGVHRFQNDDGTRTPLGKKRDSRHGKSEDYMKSQTAKKRGKEGLSNDELKKLNERLRLEEDFKKLTAEKITASESWVKKSIRDAGQQALTDFTKGIFLGSAKMLVRNISPEFAEVAFKLKEKKKED